LVGWEGEEGEDKEGYGAEGFVVEFAECGADDAGDGNEAGDEVEVDILPMLRLLGFWVQAVHATFLSSCGLPEPSPLEDVPPRRMFLAAFTSRSCFV